MSIITKAFGGVKFSVRSDRQNDEEVVREVFLNDVYRLVNLKDRGLNPKFIIDVGGHIGTFASKCKTLWPNSQIVAFEPVKENAQMYRRTMQLNGFTGVTVINKGINYDAERTVFVNGVTATGGGMFIKPQDLERCVSSGKYKLDTEILWSTLEEELEGFSFDKIELAKFDCEGGEREAFRGMTSDLLGKIGFIVGEFHVSDCVGKEFAEKYMCRFHHKVIIPKGYEDRKLGIFYAEPI